MGFSKHEIACIPTAAVHNITGSVLETRAVFLSTIPFFRHQNNKKWMPESFDVNNCVIITEQHVM